MKNLLSENQGFILFILVTILVSLLLIPQKEVVSPVPDNHILSPIPEVIPTVIPEPTKTVLKWSGTASYYSRSGCLGCSATLTMANGETLDDEKLTLAMTPAEVREHKLLNKTVTVRNTKTGSIAKARVTDTGGFGKYNRVADLSLATKQAINCTDLCHVEVTAD